MSDQVSVAALRAGIETLSKTLAETEPLVGADGAERLRQFLGAAPDVVLQPAGAGAAIVYLDHVADVARIESSVLGPLAARCQGGETPWPAQSTVVTTIGQAAEAVLNGDCVVVQSALDGAVAIPVAKWPMRATAEPVTETVVQGPHDGLIEDLGTNLALIRHRLRQPRLRWERFRPTTLAGVHGALLYVVGQARPDVLARVRRAVRRVRAPEINDVQSLAQWLTPWHGAVFPTVGLTGRIDTIVASLLGGRVVLMVDGSPLALVAPSVLNDLLHVPEDYYQSFIAATASRVMRIIGLFVTLLVAPVYVALLTMNQELVPTPLFTSIIQSRQSVPLAPLPEVLVLEVVIEVIREAGLRLPGSLGQPVAIVGAVIIGQSAVTAGLISAPTIVVVALGFISSFVIPQPNLSANLRYLRFPLILLAAAFGILGVTAGVMVLFVYLCALTSFGMPYLAPLTPLRPAGLGNTVWRTPLVRMPRPVGMLAKARWTKR